MEDLLSANLLKESRKPSLNLMNKVLSLLLKQILTPTVRGDPTLLKRFIWEDPASTLDVQQLIELIMSFIYRGNHLACSTHGSSPDSQHRRPPSQQKHLTSSFLPVEGNHKVLGGKPFRAMSDSETKRRNCFVSLLLSETVPHLTEVLVLIDSISRYCDENAFL